MTNESSIFYENSSCVLALLSGLPSAVFLVFGFLINLKSPGGLVNMTSHYGTHKFNFISNFCVENYCAWHWDGFASQFLYAFNFDGWYFLFKIFNSEFKWQHPHFQRLILKSNVVVFIICWSAVLKNFV